MDSLVKVVDLSTGNKKLIVRGKNWEELFRAAGFGLTKAMLDIETIDQEIDREIELSGEDISGLLFDFLEEVLLIKDNEGIVFSDFSIEVDDENFSLSGVLKGEKLLPNKHRLETDITEVNFDGFVTEKEEDPEEDFITTPYKAEVELVCM